MLIDSSEKFDMTLDIHYDDEWLLVLVAVDGDDVEVIDVMDAAGETPMTLSSDILEEVKLIAQCAWMEVVADVPSPDNVF